MLWSKRSWCAMSHSYDVIKPLSKQITSNCRVFILDSLVQIWHNWCCVGLCGAALVLDVCISVTVMSVSLLICSVALYARQTVPMLYFCTECDCVIHVWLQLVSTVLGHRCIGLKDLRSESKAQIHALVPTAGATERLVTIEGTVEQIQKAQYLIQKRSDSVLSALHFSPSRLFEMSQLNQLLVLLYL